MKAKRLVILIILIGFTVDLTVAQDFISSVRLRDIDSVRNVLRTTEYDTIRVNALVQLSNYYKFNRPDSAIYYSTNALTLSNKINYPAGIIDALSFLAVSHRALGNYSKALQISLQGIKIAEKYKELTRKAMLIQQIGLIYYDSKEFDLALQAMRQSAKILDSLGITNRLAFTLGSIGSTYEKMNEFDSALYYHQRAYEIGKNIQIKWLIEFSSRNLGKTYLEKGDYNLAFRYINESLELNVNATDLIENYHNIAQIYRSQNKPDSSLYYSLKSFEIAKNTGIYTYISNEALLLSDIYEKTEPLLSLEFAKISIAYRDSLELLRNNASLETLIDFDEQERQYELEAAKASNRLNIFLGSTFTLLVIAFFLIRNNRQKQKSKLQIEGAYNQLKSTQAQLIQSEKMASLGELTAGIAHEIQNPLNFVNNFSEVSSEMIEELDEEIEKGDKEEAKAISADLRENLNKIAHHGKRADAIVKGMLEHSKRGSGQKEPTDLNALADEFLRLSYQSYLAKDKEFSAELQLNLDPDLPKISVIPQDIGKVLLNLYSNAFYACAERSRSAVAEKANTLSSDYIPKIKVSTKQLPPLGGKGGYIEITVSDNGSGIPSSTKDKIFQPFFTTKPTGSGTGLGLSLSYDIVKAHGGELKVESPTAVQEVESRMGTCFTISLPKTAQI